MNRHWPLIILIAAALPGLADAQQANSARPNILLIVADDLGYADLGSFGSKIRTPNLDALAREGIRFSQFHTAPMCAPTRAMLLSGNNNHVAGMGEQDPEPPLKGRVPGYEGHLSDRIAPLPAVLRAAGYQTYMAGKWHLGVEQGHDPAAAGFERSFGLLEGGGNHFDERGFENAPNSYREDGAQTGWPQGAYSTEVYTDKLIEYIDTGLADGKPFFAYAPYTSPHWPLQVPAEDLNLYAGAYDAGYDHQREENFSNLQQAGIIDSQLALPARNDEIVPWSQLDSAQQRRKARQMELYAAMVENLDRHIGRLLAFLKSRDLYENTVVVFMSDNGAAAKDFYNEGPFVEYIRARYDNALENMGSADSFVSYGPEWAEASSAPFRLYKAYGTQGGIVAPMIIAGANVQPSNTINHSYVTVMDIAPTLIEIGRARYPQGDSVVPMRGTSLTPVMRGDSTGVHPEDEVTALFHRNQAFVRQGPWKLSAFEPPFSEQQFRLYNLTTDPAEETDLSVKHADKRQELIETWRTQRRALGIVLPQDL